MSNTHTHERRHAEKQKDSIGNKALAVGVAAVALAASAHFVKERVEAGASKNQTRIEMETVNKSQRVVSLDADTTLFGVASAAVEKGYLETDVRDASDFLTKELESQMHTSGLLGEDEKIDVGSLQPGTQLRVPAGWDGIGKPEESILTSSAYSEYDPATGKTNGVINDHEGNTKSFTEGP